MLSYDRTLCDGGACPQKAGCVRYRAIGYGRYDSFGAPPFDSKSGACAHFDPLEALRPGEAQIRERAYHLWLAAGRPEGQAQEHWLKAQAQLTQAFESDLRPA